jgi:hypothetical protein
VGIEAYHEAMDELCEVCGHNPIVALADALGLSLACLIAARAVTDVKPGASERPQEARTAPAPG